jgi:general secretion pathway protein B
MAASTDAAKPAAAARDAPPAARKPAPGSAVVAARKPPPAAPATAAAKPAAKPSEPEVPISKLNDLPDEVRRELPPIIVGGSIFSKSAANRMLVINGQVFHEGDELAPALVLEQIRQKSAVLKYKAYRYEITY